MIFHNQTVCSISALEPAVPFNWTGAHKFSEPVRWTAPREGPQSGPGVCRPGINQLVVTPLATCSGYLYSPVWYNCFYERLVKCYIEWIENLVYDKSCGWKSLMTLHTFFLVRSYRTAHVYRSITRACNSTHCTCETRTLCFIARICV